MAGDSKNAEFDIFFNMYVEELQSAGEDSQEYCRLLAVDWPAYQEASYLIVPRYLGGFEQEVSDTLLANYSSVQKAGNFLISLVNDRTYPDSAPLATPRRILEASRFTTAKKLFETKASSCMGMSEVVFLMRLFGEVVRQFELDPERGLALLQTDTDEGVVRQAFMSGLDSLVYRKSKNKDALGQAIAHTQFASSEVARLAMRAALDLKVLRYSIKTVDSDLDLSLNNLHDFSSTTSAREAMLSYLANRVSTSNTRRSGYGVEYQPRINRNLQEERRRAREEKSAEERRRRHEEQQRQRERQRSDFRTSQNRHDMPSSAQDLSVRQIILRTDPLLWKTLQAIPESDIKAVIGQVELARKECPGITDRGVYLRFHAKTQAHLASAADDNAAKILGLLMGQNFSRSAKLPF